MVRLIREWRGLLSLKDPTRVPGQVGQADADVFATIQSRERDRTGVAALRNAVRESSRNPQPVRAYEAALDRLCTLSALFERELNTATSQNVAAISIQLGHARTDVEAAKKQLSMREQQLLSAGREPLTVHQVSGLLRVGEGILGFRVTKWGTLAILLVRLDERHTAIATGGSLEANRTQLTASVAAIVGQMSGGRSYADAVAKLGQLLDLHDLAPLLSRVDHLFVVPDGPLNNLPAHLLPIAGKSLYEYTATSTLPTLSMLSAIRAVQRPDNHRNGVTAIGFPALNELPCSYPLADLPKSVKHRNVLCLGEPTGMDQLSHSLQAALGGPPPLLGAQATVRHALGGDYSQTGILLFATHALVPPEPGFPQLTDAAIVLTPSATDEADDGLLHASQIAMLDLQNIWISIIAACRSGAPGQDDPEGFTSLGFAFIAAGSRSLLVSHWYVDSEATHQLLEYAIQKMKSDTQLSARKALRLAMLNARDAHTVSVHDWGAFVLVGDGDRSLASH